MEPHENAAMWERYGKVAIRSTFSTLRSLLGPWAIDAGVVRYIDYTRERLPSFNTLEHIMHKRHFFGDEREVRAVVCSTLPDHIRAEQIDPYLTPDHDGFLAPVDLNALIQGVVLYPDADGDLAARVAELCVAGNLPSPVRSAMATEVHY
jgi:hypothetical protein